MATELAPLLTSSFDPNAAAKERNSRAYAKLADLQISKETAKRDEDEVIKESMMRYIKDDGQFDRDAIKIDLRKKVPHRVSEIEDGWAETDLKAANADKAFDMKDPLLRAQQLKNAQDELDLLGNLIRPVLEVKEEDKEPTYQAMVSTAVNKYKMDPKMFAPNYNAEDMDKLNAKTMSGQEWVKTKTAKKDADRLNQWKTIAPDYKARILRGVRDPVEKAAVYFDIMNKWGDVPEAVTLVKGIPLREPPQDTPAGLRQEDKTQFSQRLLIRKDFESKIGSLIGRGQQEGMDNWTSKMNESWAQYTKMNPTEKNEQRRAIQDVILFGFSKLEDPSSVVMPGEFKRLTINQGSLGSRVYSAVHDKAFGGLGSLPDEALYQMVRLGNVLQGAVIEKYRPNYERFKEDITDINESKLQSEIRPYVRFFEKPSGTDKPAEGTSTEYTEQRPLVIRTSADAAGVPKGTWIQYKSKSTGKIVTVQRK